MLHTTEVDNFIAGSASEKMFKIGEYLAKLQARTWLSHALCAPGQHTAKNEESARDNNVLSCNFAKYTPILNIFHWETQQ